MNNLSRVQLQSVVGLLKFGFDFGRVSAVLYPRADRLAESSCPSTI